MKKGLKIAGIVLVVLLVIVFVAVSFFLGSIIKTAVEKGGPVALGVPVTLQKASVMPLSGRASLKELVIGNPEGFKTPFLFRMGELTVLMDVASLSSDTIVIRKIHVTGPEISYEKSLTTSNIGQLLKNLEGEEKPPAETPEEQPEEKTGGGTKVVIEDFLFEGGKIRLSATLTGGHSLVVPLPPIHMTDIGKDKGGASPKEVVTEIFKTILGAVTKAVTASVEFVGDGVKVVGGAAMEGAEAVGDAAQKGTEAATDAAKKAGEMGVEGVKAVGGVAAEGVEKTGEAAKKVGSAIGSGAGKVFKGVGGLLPGGGGEEAAEAEGEKSP